MIKNRVALVFTPFIKGTLILILVAALHCFWVAKLKQTFHFSLWHKTAGVLGSFEKDKVFERMEIFYVMFSSYDWVQRTQKFKRISGTSSWELFQIRWCYSQYSRPFNINMIWRTKSVALFNSLIVSPRIHVRRKAGLLLTFILK